MFKFQLLLSAIFAVAIAQTTYDYCSLLDDVFEICQSSTPGFTNLPATGQASCLCGTQLNTISWGANAFDGLVGQCARQAAATDTSLAADASRLSGFCTTIGSGSAPSSRTAATTGMGTMTTASQTSAGGVTSATGMTGAGGVTSGGGITTGPTTRSNMPGTTTKSVVVVSTSSAAAQKALVKGQHGVMAVVAGLGGMLFGRI